MADSPFTIGIIQDHATDDVAGNVARAERLVRDAARKGAQIICLKELFNAPYFCKAQEAGRFDLAEPIPGPTTARPKKNPPTSWGRRVLYPLPCGLLTSTAGSRPADPSLYAHPHFHASRAHGRNRRGGRAAGHSA